MPRRFPGFIFSTYTVAPVSNCAGLAHFEGIAAILATSSSSFLFLVRVRAVYENSPTVTAFFASFWLAIVGTGFLFLSAVQTSVRKIFCTSLTTNTGVLTMIYLAECCGHEAMCDNWHETMGHVNFMGQSGI